MALLDVLSIVFDADADKLKKGAGEAEQVIEETKDTVTDTDKAAEKLGDTFLDTIGSAKGAIAGLLSLGGDNCQRSKPGRSNGRTREILATSRGKY